MRKQRSRWLDVLLLGCDQRLHADYRKLNLADVVGSQTWLIFELPYNCSTSGAN